MTKLYRTPRQIELARTSCSPSAGYCLSFQIKELPGRRFHTWLREDLSLKDGVIYNNNADPSKRMEATRTHSAETKLWYPSINSMLAYVQANGLKGKAEDLLNRQLAEEEAVRAEHIASENLKNDAEEMLRLLRWAAEVLASYEAEVGDRDCGVRSEIEALVEKHNGVAS